MVRSVRLQALLLFAVVAAVPGRAHAQAHPAPAAPAPGAAAAETEPSEAMLAPAARPRRTVATWNEALAHVRARSTELRSAQADVAQAEALSRIALAGALPTLAGSATGTHQFLTNPSSQVVGIDAATRQPIFREFTSPTSNYVQAQGQLVAPVLALGAWHAIGTASLNTDGARLSVEDTKRTISLNVASTLVGVVAAERIAELIRSGLRDALQRLEFAQRRRTLGGAATILDVVRAQQDTEAARATLIAGDESLRQAREALGLALGLPEEVGVAPGFKLAGFERSATGACATARSIEDMPNVAAARLDVEAAEHAVGDVSLSFVPTVGIQSSVTTTTIDTGASPNTLWNIQAVLSVPIFDGGVRYGNLRNANAKLDRFEQTLESTRRKTTILVAQARRAVAVAEQARKTANDGRTAASENDRLTRLAFGIGQGTSTDLILAAASLRQADVGLALREFDLVRARIVAIITAAARCEL